MRQLSLPPNVKLLSTNSLWRLLKDLSEKLTEKTNETLKLIGAGDVARVQLSLLRKWEGMKEIDMEVGVSLGRRIYGEYLPEFAEIYIYLGSVRYDADTDSYIDTLFHEIVHHLQYTDHPFVKVRLNINEGRRIRMSLPYFARPHEIEAFSKSQSLLKDLESKDPRLLEEIRDIISRAVQFAKMLLREFKIRIEFQDSLFALMKSFHIIQINPPDAPNAPFNVIIYGPYTRAYGKAYCKEKVLPPAAILIPDGITSNESLVISMETNPGTLHLRKVKIDLKEIEGILIFDYTMIEQITPVITTPQIDDVSDMFHLCEPKQISKLKNITLKKSNNKVIVEIPKEPTGKFGLIEPPSKTEEDITIPSQDADILIKIDRIEILTDQMPEKLKRKIEKIMSDKNSLVEYFKEQLVAFKKALEKFYEMVEEINRYARKICEDDYP